MEILYIILIFVIVSFFYVHIVNQFKTSDDLEIYEFDYKDNDNLQETCDILQPVIFLRNEQFSIPCLDNYRQLLNLKDSFDYYKEVSSVQSIELPCKSLLELLKTDTLGHFFSENNQTFIDESGLYKNIIHLDKELKPKFCFQPKYDILMGSINTCFPLRFHTETRKYLYNVNGSVKVKMCSHKFTKYLHLVDDYENLEFFSPINPWKKEQVYQEYSADLENVQFIEFSLPVNHILYVPKYWWYSVKILEQDTQILEYNYSTIMNRLAHVQDLGKWYLQNQNITNSFTKSIDSIIENEIEIKPVETEIEKKQVEMESEAENTLS